MHKHADIFDNGWFIVVPASQAWKARIKEVCMDQDGFMACLFWAHRDKIRDHRHASFPGQKAIDIWVLLLKERLSQLTQQLYEFFLLMCSSLMDPPCLQLVSNFHLFLRNYHYFCTKCRLGGVHRNQIII